jgi:superfamily II RNA helicase
MQTNIISLDSQLEELNKIISSTGEDISQLESLMELENLSNQYIGGFKITLGKDQQKKLKKLEGVVKANKKLYGLRDSVIKRNKLRSELKYTINEIESLNSYMDFLAGQNMRLLELWGYTQSGDVSIKGIIASQINECNSIILTEVIVRDYLYGLSPQEIVGLVAIFTEPIKADTIDGIIRKSSGTPEINLRLSKIEQFIESYKHDEESIMGSDFSDWTLSHSYIDIALAWANGITTQEITLLLGEYGEYEGQFVKNMTRVYNIINDIGCICKMTGKIDLLPSLESASQLIIRDIVNVNSLYLS